MKPVRLMETNHNPAFPKTDATTEVSKISVSFLSLFAAVIGCWAVVGLVSAMVNSGGIGQLIKSFATVIIG